MKTDNSEKQTTARFKSTSTGRTRLRIDYPSSYTKQIMTALSDVFIGQTDVKIDFNPPVTVIYRENCLDLSSWQMMSNAVEPRKTCAVCGAPTLDGFWWCDDHDPFA